MNLRFCAPAIVAGLSALFLPDAALAADTTVADRINRAEARAAAYQAENNQLKTTVTTQAAALRRLDQQVLDLEQQLNEQFKRQQEEQTPARQQLSRSEEAYQQELQAQRKATEAELVSLRRALQTSNQAGAQQHAELTELKSTVARQKSQLAHVMQRNQVLQANLSQTAPLAEFASLQTENTALKQAQSQQNTLLEELKLRNQKLLAALEQSPSSGEVEALRREKLNLMQRQNSQADTLRRSLEEEQARHQALQDKYARALEAVRAAEANTAQIKSTAASAQTPQQPRGDDVRALEEALRQAKAVIRTNEQRLASEIEMERTLHARSEVELEQQFQLELERLQRQLKACRGG